MYNNCLSCAPDKRVHTYRSSQPKNLIEIPATITLNHVLQNWRALSYINILVKRYLCSKSTCIFTCSISQHDSYATSYANMIYSEWFLFIRHISYPNIHIDHISSIYCCMVTKSIIMIWYYIFQRKLYVFYLISCYPYSCYHS